MEIVEVVQSGRVLFEAFLLRTDERIGLNVLLQFFQDDMFVELRSATRDCQSPDVAFVWILVTILFAEDDGF